MSVYWLDPNEINFPHPSLADDIGILAAGGDLSPQRLLLAYSWGIFPWYNEGEPIVWWHPDPRFVLFPDGLKISKSMRAIFNQKKFQVTFDHNFEAVINGCQNINRKGQQGGTWITSEMEDAYIHLHKMGYAHSVEVWQNDELVGGLYGIAIGEIFFGESMFTRVSNASKAAFITLVETLKKRGFKLIDCQQETQHLKSLGAKSISRNDFLSFLEKNQKITPTPASWHSWQ